MVEHIPHMREALDSVPNIVRKESQWEGEKERERERERERENNFYHPNLFYF
jgi:hypothetical protein